MHSLAPQPADPSPRALVVSIDLRTGRVVVAGELDRDCAHHLLDALAALGHTRHPVWVVDLARVTYCDAAGLRALARGDVLARARGRTLRLVGPGRFLTELLDLVGLRRLLPGRAQRPVRLRPSAQPWRCSTKS